MSTTKNVGSQRADGKPHAPHAPGSRARLRPVDPPVEKARRVSLDSESVDTALGLLDDAALYTCDTLWALDHFCGQESPQLRDGIEAMGALRTAAWVLRRAAEDAPRDAEGGDAA